MNTLNTMLDKQDNQISILHTYIKQARTESYFSVVSHGNKVCLLWCVQHRAHNLIKICL